MYRFEAQQPVFHSLNARNIRPEHDDQEDWDSSLNFLWLLEGQAYSPSQMSSGVGLPAKSLPLHFFERPIRNDAPLKHVPKAAFARNSVDRCIVRQTRPQQPEQVGWLSWEDNHSPTSQPSPLYVLMHVQCFPPQVVAHILPGWVLQLVLSTRQASGIKRLGNLLDVVTPVFRQQ